MLYIFKITFYIKIFCKTLIITYFNKISFAYICSWSFVFQSLFIWFAMREKRIIRIYVCIYSYVYMYVTYYRLLSTTSLSLIAIASTLRFFNQMAFNQEKVSAHAFRRRPLSWQITHFASHLIARYANKKSIIQFCKSYHEIK